MSKKITRRQILKLMAIAAGASVVACTKLDESLKAMASTVDKEIFLPLISSATETATPPPTATQTPLPSETPDPSDTPVPSETPPPPTYDPRVVHIHNQNVSNWDGSDGAYWNYVNQAEVDKMVDQGILWLTGKSTLSDAWGTVLPSYQPGQKIAIKVSFNNISGTEACGDNTSDAIDGIIEPVNAIVRGLKTIGVQENDIHIYETIRNLPHRFVDGCDFPGVQFFDRGGCGNLENTFESNDPNAIIHFNPPTGNPPNPLRINDILINATYLINVPIMKIHGMAGWSLAMKNHFGTTQMPGELHQWSSLGSPDYTPSYSPIVDIYLNPHIRNKTILTVADGIFSAYQQTAPPKKWNTFNNDYPKSLFFSFDPVAIDCVMGDLLSMESDAISYNLPGEKADDHLVIAQDYGLGTYERGNPWASPSSNGYSIIDYQKIEI